MDIRPFPVARSEVFWYVFDKGTATAQDIAGGICMAKSTVQGHLAALEKVGVLRKSARPKFYVICEIVPSNYATKLQEHQSLARSAWRLRGIEPI